MTNKKDGGTLRLRWLPVLLGQFGCSVSCLDLFSRYLCIARCPSTDTPFQGSHPGIPYSRGFRPLFSCPDRAHGSHIGWIKYMGKGFCGSLLMVSRRLTLETLDKDIPLVTVQG